MPSIADLFGFSLYNPAGQVSSRYAQQQADDERSRRAQYEAARQQAMSNQLGLAAMQSRVISADEFRRYYAGEWTNTGRVTREDVGTQACLQELLPSLVGAIDIGADVGFFTLAGSKWCAIKLPAGYSFNHSKLVDSYECCIDNKDRIQPYNIYRWED